MPSESPDLGDPVEALHPRFSPFSWVRSGRRRWGLARLVMFVGLAILLSIDQRDQLTRMIPGDPGDAFIILAFLQWGGDRAMRLYQGYWAGPIFASGKDAMAYSDTLLPLTVPFKLLETITGSRVIAFNVLFLSSWVLCAEFTYRLALRLVRSRAAAVVAAVAYTFSTIRLAQTNHFQIAWACLIPLVVLALFRFWDRPSAGRGLALAASIVAQFLISAYHGVILVAAVGAALTISSVVSARRGDLRRELPGYATFTATFLIPMLYIRGQYASAATSTAERTEYPSAAVLALGDLRAPAPTASLIRHIGVFDPEPFVASPEKYAYVGLFVLFAVPILIVVALWSPRQRSQLLTPTHEWATVLGIGALGFLLAVGRGPILGLDMPFYDVGRRVIPGLSAMVAPVRLTVFAQLALCLLAGAGLATVLRVIERRSVRATIAAVLIALISSEAQTTHSMVRVVEMQPGSVNEYLESRDKGIVALLPVSPLSLGVVFSFTEGPRMVLGSDDDLQSFNGYSGYAPIGYETSSEIINTFPSPDSLAELRRLDVRYVALLTAPAETGIPAVDDLVNESGFAYMPREDALARVAELPTADVASVQELTDGFVVTLTNDDH